MHVFVSFAGSDDACRHCEIPELIKYSVLSVNPTVVAQTDFIYVFNAAHFTLAKLLLICARGLFDEPGHVDKAGIHSAVYKQAFKILTLGSTIIVIFDSHKTILCMFKTTTNDKYKYNSVSTSIIGPHIFIMKRPDLSNTINNNSVIKCYNRSSRDMVIVSSNVFSPRRLI